MQTPKIEVDNNLQETTKHGSFDFPIAIYTDKFNLLEDGYIRWHWHKELLLKSKKSISIIAFDVGFNGVSYFGKVFKKYMNCTPSEYRNKYSVK